ncbi:hypothetical protein GUJ93_ZPchr0007g4552 [Zizania palustris]|uniref:Bifunctional inhibitor/plant lipid transfer protein/seed storage helical domain-containing protein n=1 Tax=Zizania palustris TaxID=103762 RepID=A0A8J5TJU0_ZIZPA|nr:hypothetical protein GUJ93_ZPchr0007g4552 [Zizania palustris]
MTGMRAEILVVALLSLLQWQQVVVVVVGEQNPGRQDEAAGTASCGGSGYLGALIQLMVPCKAAVAPFSPARPSGECCAAVRELGQRCLCLLLAGPPISGADGLMLSRLPAACAADHLLLFSSCP